MFGKSFLSVMIVTSAFTLVFGQTPEAKKEKEKSPQAFAFAFDGGGSYLGVQTQEVNRENFEKFGLREVRGVAVEKVMENSPAAAAGLQAGDVIIRVNGDEVTSARKLTRLISEIDPDHQVKVTVLRNGKEREFTATLEKRKMPAFENGTFNVETPMGKLELPDMKDMPDFKNLPDGETFRSFKVPGGEGKVFAFRTGGRQIGVGITPLTKQLSSHFGVDGGVMISEVRENSPAEKAGLKAGDIIVEANGTAVKGYMDLTRILNDKKEGDVTLTIVRDGNRQTISVTPEASKDGNFFYQGDGEDGLTLPVAPAAPGQLHLVRPATPLVPSMPVTAPAPLVLVRPGRVI
jgi:C-terminal processing protease CtpA/Prc